MKRRTRTILVTDLRGSTSAVARLAKKGSRDVAEFVRGPLEEYFQRLLQTVADWRQRVGIEQVTFTGDGLALVMKEATTAAGLAWALQTECDRFGDEFRSGPSARIRSIVGDFEFDTGIGVATGTVLECAPQASESWARALGLDRRFTGVTFNRVNRIVGKARPTKAVLTPLFDVRTSVSVAGASGWTPFGTGRFVINEKMEFQPPVKRLAAQDEYEKLYSVVPSGSPLAGLSKLLDEFMELYVAGEWGGALKTLRTLDGELATQQAAVDALHGRRMRQRWTGLVRSLSYCL